MPRPRHPNKEIEAALKYAEARDWRIQVGGAHAWGFILCPREARDGCLWSVYSTPRNPQNHANFLRKMIDQCPHQGA